MKFSSIVIFNSFLVGEAALASEAIVVPKTVTYQAANLLVLILIAAFLLRGGKFSAFFLNRRKNYLGLLDKAQKVKQEANLRKQEVNVRLQKLEANASSSVQRAQQEAEQISREMVKEAKAQAEQIQREAVRAAEVELEKARENMRVELVTRSIEASRENIKKSMAAQDQKRLQEEFIERLSVVR